MNSVENTYHPFDLKNCKVKANPSIIWDDFKNVSSQTYIPPLRQVNDVHSGRYYVLSDSVSDSQNPVSEGLSGSFHGTGKLFSVTNILGHNPKKQKALAEWRQRVGEQEAKKISSFAANRGTALHNLIEKFLSNDIIDLDEDVMPHQKPMFMTAIRSLESHIKEITCLEQRLFSFNLGVAGTVDGICQWDNFRAVLDFKTSRKLKKKEWIEDYFLQTTAYSLMWEELVGERIDKLVVFILVDDQDEPQIFIDSREKYIPILLQRIYRFYDDKKISEFPKIFVDIPQKLGYNGF